MPSSYTTQEKGIVFKELPSCIPERPSGFVSRKRGLITLLILFISANISPCMPPWAATILCMQDKATCYLNTEYLKTKHTQVHKIMTRNKIIPKKLKHNAIQIKVPCSILLKSSKMYIIHPCPDFLITATYDPTPACHQIKSTATKPFASNKFKLINWNTSP